MRTVNPLSVKASIVVPTIVSSVLSSAGSFQRKIYQYFPAPELLLPPVELSEAPGILPLSVPAPVAEPEVPPVDAPPDVPLGLPPSVPPVPAAGLDGSVPGVFVVSGGGVDAAGAEELGVLLVGPPDVP